MNNVKGRFALLEIDKYPTIDWGVHCVFQSNDKTVVEAYKIVKEDAVQRAREEIDEDDLGHRTDTTYTIIDLLDS